jgi:hypothetical protein
MPDFDTDAILARLKRDYPFPSGAPSYTDANILNLMNDVIRDFITPLIIQFKEEHFLTYDDVTITTGVYNYAIPKKAVGNRIRKLQILDGNNELVVDHVPLAATNRNWTSNNGYFISANNIVFAHPENWSGRTLRVWYYRLLNKLVATTRAGAITNVPNTTSIGLTGSAPSNIVVDSYVDFIDQNNPFIVKGTSKVFSVVGLIVTMYTAFSGFTPVIGDYICSAGETNIPNMPEDYHGLIVSKTASRIASSIGNTSRYQIAEADYNTLVQSISGIISNRDEGDMPDLVPSSESLI